MTRCAAEYALYKGDTFVDVGTLEELAKKRGVAVNTIRYFGTPAYSESNPNGMKLIKIERDEIKEVTAYTKTRPTRIVVGENIKRYREEKGMNITQLSQEMGVPPHHVTRYEKAKTNISADKIDQFAYALGVKPLDLLEDWSEEE